MGCEKDQFTASDFTDNQADAISKTLPTGKGVQKIVASQTNDDLERGTAVSIPLFPAERDEVTVKMGTWVTLRFSVQDNRPGTCPMAPTTEFNDEILDGAIQFVEDEDLAIAFDGQDIDVASHFRSEGLELIYVPQSDECVSRLPWRYYVNPQAKGSYEFTNDFRGFSFSRLISWSPKSK
jgi:hypothetical protein